MLRSTLAACQFLAGRGKGRVAGTPVLPGRLPPLLHILQNSQQFLSGGKVPGDACLLEQIFDPITQAAPERAVQAVHHAARVIERDRALRIRRFQMRVRYNWQESPEE